MLEFVSYDPSMSLMKYIFVDLDECLLHAKYAGNANRNVEKFKRIAKREQNYGPSFLLDCGEVYSTKLRPGALDLLKRLRDVYGNENVRMLTASVREYAEKNNEAHGLGWRPNQILTRENMNKMNFGIKDEIVPFEPGYVALIDNLYHRDNLSKLQYLHPLVVRGFVSYVNVPEYWGHEDDFPFDEEYINQVFERIEDGFLQT